MSQFFTILGHDLLISFRHFSRIFAGILFFLITVFIFFLISQDQLGQRNTATQLINVIWISLLFSAILASFDFLKKDFESGEIEQLLVSCPNCEVIVLAKIIAAFLSYSLPTLLILPLLFSLGCFDQEISYRFLTIFFLASIVINFITAFCGSFSMLGNSAPMMAIVALPLTIPVLILANAGMNDYFASLKLLIGLVFLIGCVVVLAVAKIIKISCE